MAGSSRQDDRSPNWQKQLMHRFAAKEDAELLQATAPGLAELATALLPRPTMTDLDLVEFVRIAVSFLENKSGAEDRELVARASAGAAFLFAGGTPSKHELNLIAEGNHVHLAALDPASKRVRDTWAFMTYKRALGGRRDISYTQKRGQDLRNLFADALVVAIATAEADPSGFAAHARDETLKDQSLRGLNYEMSSRPEGLRVDRSRLVRDVTIPDGSRVPLGARFVKTWELQNVGNVPWIGRQLRRMTAQASSLPASPDLTPIPDTLPREFVQVSVPIVASRVQGTSEIYFKMVDSDGNICFPSRYAHGLTVLIETGDFDWLPKEV